MQKYVKTVACVYLAYYNSGIDLYDLAKEVLCRERERKGTGLKSKGKRAVGRADLVPMLLTPLMGGDMPEKERVLRGFSWLKEEPPDVTKDEHGKMQAVLYALACKVLAKDELAEVKEAVGMTLLGQMLMEDGIKKGREQGLEQGIEALITTCRELGLGYEETMEKVKKSFDLSDGAAQGYLDRFWN